MYYFMTLSFNSNCTDAEHERFYDAAVNILTEFGNVADNQILVHPDRKGICNFHASVEENNRASVVAAVEMFAAQADEHRQTLYVSENRRPPAL